MTTSSRFKSILFFAALITFIMPAYIQAEEYKWLKTSKYKEIFVYTDFNGYDFLADKLNETIKRTLLHSKIKPTISDSMAFLSTEINGEFVYEELDNKLIDKQKIILHIYGKCIEYNSVFIYQFDIHFGVLNKRYSQALLYSSPRHNVMGADSINGIDRAFRKLIKNAVADYLSANTKK